MTPLSIVGKHSLLILDDLLGRLDLLLRRLLLLLICLFRGLLRLVLHTLQLVSSLAQILIVGRPDLEFRKRWSLICCLALEFCNKWASGAASWKQPCSARAGASIPLQESLPLQTVKVLRKVVEKDEAHSRSAGSCISQTPPPPSSPEVGSIQHVR